MDEDVKVLLIEDDNGATEVYRLRVIADGVKRVTAPKALPSV